MVCSSQELTCQQMYNKFCIVCKGRELSSANINFGKTPWSNNFHKKKKYILYPLNLLKCKECKAVQLDYFVKKEVMFLNHEYLSGLNIELKKHFKKIAEKIKKKKRSGNILDIGSNDGTFLNCFNQQYNKFGFEPCKHITVENKNIKTIRKFFSYSEAKKLKNNFDIIHASGVFFHLEELHSVTKGIKKLLKRKGEFIIQFIYLKDLIKKAHFDQIYHEHLIYYTIGSLNKILNIYDLQIFDIYKSCIHGGSLIAHVCHKGVWKLTARYKKLKTKDIEFENKFDHEVLNFHKKIELRKKIINTIIASKKIDGRIVALGAPAKATTLLKIFNLTKKKIDFALEVNPKKIGCNIPGTDIPVIDENSYKYKKNDIFFALTWNFIDSIKKKLTKKFKKNKLIFISPHSNE